MRLNDEVMAAGEVRRERDALEGCVKDLDGGRYRVIGPAGSP